MKTNLQLTLGENNVLESIYGRQIDGLSGYNPRKLESVEDLTAYEKKFFTDKNFVSPHFFVQTLYKVRGSVSPIKFNLAVNQMLRENKNLRANFCNLGTRTVKVVRPASLVKPEILFRNLTQKNKDELDSDFIKIFEADMRRDVDFRHDALIRFAVYRTSKEDFAVLVTMPQIVSESFNADKFFADVTDTPAEIKPQKIAAELSPKNQEAIREYWAKILDKAPPTAILPFEKKASGA
ncbi:MAG: hypothetical protein J5497_05940, partial [Selenomonadaceae bacterium]|nr:hypothetical protein [Selenomonadaceae bacterium]